MHQNAIFHRKLERTSSVIFCCLDWLNQYLVQLVMNGNEMYRVSSNRWWYLVSNPVLQ